MSVPAWLSGLGTGTLLGVGFTFFLDWLLEKGQRRKEGDALLTCVLTPLVAKECPIISFTIEEQVAEGDTVVTKYRQSSVDRGEVMSIPPTGEEITEEGIYIHRISGGKITEECNIADALPVMEYLAREHVSASASSRNLE